jgi:AcrR family transcriptional regulator
MPSLRFDLKAKEKEDSMCPKLPAPIESTVRGKTEKPGKPDEVRKPKKRDREASALKILHAGLAVFSEIGYDAATTKMISQRSGVAEALIHRYFESKAGLLSAIFKHHIDEVDPTGFYPPGETVESEIISFFKSWIVHGKKDNEILKLILSRAIIDPEISKIFQMETRPPAFKTLEDRLKLFQKQRKIRADVNIKDLATNIMDQSLVVGFLGRAVFARTDEQVMKILRSFTKCIVFGVRT